MVIGGDRRKSGHPDEVVMAVLNVVVGRNFILGQLERIAYAPQGLPKFEWVEDDGVLQVAYQNSRVAVH